MIPILINWSLLDDIYKTQNLKNSKLKKIKTQKNFSEFFYGNVAQNGW